MPESVRNDSGSTKRKSRQRKSSPRKPRKRTVVLTVVGTLFLTGVAAGYLVGTANSPKYDDPTNSPALIRSVVGSLAKKEVSDDWIIEVGPDGRLKSFHPRIARLSFSCGAVDVREYDAIRHVVVRGPAPRAESTTIPRFGLSYLNTIGFLVGGTQAYTLASAGRQVEESWAMLTAGKSVAKKIGFVAAVLVITSVGFGVGYYFGYDNRVRCGEPMFQKLLDDSVFWKGVESDLVSDHHWLFEYLDGGRYPVESFFNWPLSVRPSGEEIDTEITALLRRPLVRVRVMSWHAVNVNDFRLDSDAAHLHDRVQPILESLSPISLKCDPSRNCLTPLK